MFAGSPASADLSSDDLRELESLLVLLGFDPGPVDGIADAQTADAIKAYQSFAALRVDGVASPALLEELRGVTQSLGTVEDRAPAEAAPAATAGTAGPDDERAQASEADKIVAGPPAAPAAGGAWDTAIHLASFRQESKAQVEWRRLQRRLPDLLGDMTALIREIDLGDKGLFYRLYAGPFPNLATAQDFCVMVNLEGFDCGTARGAALQVAVSGTAAPGIAGGAEIEDSQSRPEANAEAEAEPEERPAEPEMPALDEPGEAVPTIGSDAPEPPAISEVTAAAEPPDVTEFAATDEAATVEQIPENVAESPPPVDAPAAPAEELVPRAAVGAPTILVTAAQIAEASPGGFRQAPAEGRPSATGAGAPTVLIPPTQFAAAAGEDIEHETAGPPEAIAVTRAPAVMEPGPPAAAASQETQTAALVGTGAEDYATATAAFEAGDCASAVRSYTQAFEKGGLPRRALAAGYNNRGRCFFDQARYEDALADFDKAIELDREFAAAYYNRGRAHNATGDSAQGQADLDTAYNLGFGRLESEP